MQNTGNQRRAVYTTVQPTQGPQSKHEAPPPARWRRLAAFGAWVELKARIIDDAVNARIRRWGHGQ